MKKKWWHDKVAYQIYPKSFLDTNGDGIGDLGGIISKLDYLKELGIDIIWLSPIYKSPFVDQGYDISDYYAIAEEFGTMEQFEELLAEAKKRDMYIIMDLVINHCSDQHEWFQKALADPEGEYADYFYYPVQRYHKFAVRTLVFFCFCGKPLDISFFAYFIRNYKGVAADDITSRQKNVAVFLFYGSRFSRKHRFVNFDVAF